MRKPDFSKITDRDLRLVSLGIAFFISLSFTRFGLIEYTNSGLLTTTVFFSPLFTDIMLFICGWLLVLLFMLNVKDDQVKE